MKTFEKNTVPECLKHRIVLVHDHPWIKVNGDGASIELCISNLLYEVDGDVFLMGLSKPSNTELRVFIPDPVEMDASLPIPDSSFNYQLQEKGGVLWCTVGTLYGENTVEVCLERLYRNDAGDVMLRMLVEGVLTDVKVA